MTQIYAASNIVGDDSVFGGHHPRNVVVIAFTTGTSQPDRQAAIASIGGEVIGGLPIDDGAFYYVRIPDNGGTAALYAAVRTVSANVHVDFANPALMGAFPNWLAPVDGTGWKKAHWPMATS